MRYTPGKAYVNIAGQKIVCTLMTFKDYSLYLPKDNEISRIWTYPIHQLMDTFYSTALSMTLVYFKKNMKS